MAYTVLSQDTGTSNCGFSVARYTKNSITFLEIGQIVSTIRNLTDDTQYINPTKKERAKIFEFKGNVVPSQSQYQASAFLKVVQQVDGSIVASFDMSDSIYK